MRPLFNNSEVLEITPGETKTIQFEGVLDYYLSYNVPDKSDLGVSEYEDIVNFRVEWDEYGWSYYATNIVLDLFDDNKNKLYSFVLSHTQNESFTLNQQFSLRNGTLKTQNICYFEIHTMFEVTGNQFYYDLEDTTTGSIVRTNLPTHNTDIHFSLKTLGLNIKEIGSNDVRPFIQTDNSVYIIPSKCYEVDLNGEWMRNYNASISDSSDYDGPYCSWSNKGVDNSGSKMFIDIHGYDTFKILVRSDSEGGYSSTSSKTLYDGVIVSQLDKDIEWDTDINDTTLVKHSQINVNVNSDISSYTEVSFTNIGGGDHRITIIYKKDGSEHERGDCGYVVIPTGQEKYSMANIYGTKRDCFWDEPNVRYWPSTNYLSILKSYDNMIVAQPNALKCYRYDSTTGKHVFTSQISTYSTYDGYRFGGNYNHILNYASENVLRFATQQWTTTKNGSYKNIHVYLDFNGGEAGTSTITPRPTSFAGIHRYTIVDNSIFNNISGSGYNNIIFYPGRIRDAYSVTSSLSPIRGNNLTDSSKIQPYNKGDIIAYFIPRRTDISTSVYVKAYAAHCQSDGSWDPYTSGGTTTIVELLTSFNLYPAYNNIVLVKDDSDYNTIDIYRYDIEGKLIMANRNIKFGK
jgi:hypothetical protein